MYIATNKKHGVLYVGKTGNMLIRGFQHATGNGSLFTKKYNCDKIVYIELYQTEYEAIKREKQLKNWKRDWKISLIEEQNPTWKNYRDIT